MLGVRQRLKDVLAVRLEILPDDSLPAHGPGRAGNGNCILTDFKIAADARPVALQRPRADYGEKDYPVAHALDDDKASGWGISGQAGKPHVAVFEPLKPFDANTLGIILDHQSKWPNHNVGRFRISVALAEDSKP